MSVLITACCLAYQVPVCEDHFREHSREGHVFEILVMCVKHTPMLLLTVFTLFDCALFK